MGTTVTLPAKCLCKDWNEYWCIQGIVGENMNPIMARVSLFLILICANLCAAQDNSGTNSALRSSGVELQSPEETAPVSHLATEAPSEKWTELNAARSGLDPTQITSTVLARWDFADYTSELVRAEWRANDPIELYVVRPHNVVKPPAILYLYNFPADTDRFKEKAWCEFVTRNGFAAVGFVSALTGQRYHTRPMREWFVSELQESLGTTTHDVQMILDYLASRGDVNVTRIGMLGEGSGGAIAILAAAADPRIRFVHAINPWGDWPDWLKVSAAVPDREREAYLKPEFVKSLAPLDPVSYLPQLGSDRIRIEQVAADPITPGSVQAKIAACAPSPSSVVQYPNVRVQIQSWTAPKGWLELQLQTASAQATTAEVNHNIQALKH